MSTDLFKDLRVRSRFQAFFDKGRILEKVIKAKFFDRRDYTLFPDYDLISKKYPRIPSDEEVRQLYADLKTSNQHEEDLIYQYWHQGNSSEKSVSNSGTAWHPVHKMSYLSLEKYHKDKHVLLDYDSLHDYVNPPTALYKVIQEKGRFPMISDIARMMLLFVNGGTWCDFTIVLFNHIPRYVYDNDFFIPVRGSKPENWKDYFYFDKGTFRWEETFKVRNTPGFQYSKPMNMTLGKILFKFLEIVEGEKSNLDILEYYIYLQTIEYIFRNDEESIKLFEHLSTYPSDVLLHHLCVYCSSAFSEEWYQKVKKEMPIQRIKLSTRFFKGCMAYECLKREGY